MIKVCIFLVLLHIYSYITTPGSKTWSVKLHFIFTLSASSHQCSVHMRIKYCC